jgi:hypothetical protein
MGGNPEIPEMPEHLRTRTLQDQVDEDGEPDHQLVSPLRAAVFPAGGPVRCVLNPRHQIWSLLLQAPEVVSIAAVIAAVASSGWRCR